MAKVGGVVDGVGGATVEHGSVKLKEHFNFIHLHHFKLTVKHCYILDQYLEMNMC